MLAVRAISRHSRRPSSVPAFALALLAMSIASAASAAPMGWGGGGGGGGGSGTVNNGTSGQLAYYGAAGAAVSGTTVGGDCSFSGPTTFTCTKTGGTAFGSFATGTSAGNLTGTLNVARLPALNLCTDYPTPGAFAPTWTAGHTYCLGGGTYTIAAAQAINVAGVAIHCTSKAAILQRTGATDGLDVTAAQFDVEGCTFDGNTQSGAGTGPLINLNGADDAVVHNNYFQNTGTTNTQTGTIWVQKGLRVKILDNTATTAQTDTFIWVNAQSGANTVQDLSVTNNKIPTFAPVTNLFAIDVNQNTGNASTHIKVDDNQIILTTTHAEGIAWHAPAVVENTSVLGGDVSRNQVYATAAAPRLIHLFGFDYGTVAGNILDDGANAISGALLDLGDVYNTTVTANQISGRSAAETGIACVDCAQNTISANTIDGIANNTFGIYIECVAGSASNDTIAGNTVRLSGGATALEIQANGCAASNAMIVGNTFAGPGASASTTGIAIVDTSGTMDSNAIAENSLSGFAGTANNCINVAAGATHTYVSHNDLQTCTTSLADAGTNSTDDIWDGVTSVTLAAGTKTATFPIPCVGVLGVCQDTTTASNKCTIAFTSSTTTACTATVTGTSTDNCTCTAQVH
jgi:hypothetical protein